MANKDFHAPQLFWLQPPLNRIYRDHTMRPFDFDLLKS